MLTPGTTYPPPPCITPMPLVPVVCPLTPTQWNAISSGGPPIDDYTNFLGIKGFDDNLWDVKPCGTGLFPGGPDPWLFRMAGPTCHWRSYITAGPNEGQEAPQLGLPNHLDRRPVLQSIQLRRVGSDPAFWAVHGATGSPTNPIAFYFIKNYGEGPTGHYLYSFGCGAVPGSIVIVNA